MIYRLFSLRDIAKTPFLRTAPCHELPVVKWPYKKFIDCVTFDSGKRPKGGISENDYGQAISLGGEQLNEDGTVVTEEFPYVSFDYYDESNKGKVNDNDILICKDGARTGKTSIIRVNNMPTSKIMVNEHVFIIRANASYRQDFLFYIMRTKLFQDQIIDLAYRKKAQPGLSIEHLNMIKIPGVPLPAQNSLMASIKPYMKKIDELSANRVSPQQLIDTAFQKEFGFDYDKFDKLKAVRIYKMDSLSFSNNPDLRFSAKFHRSAGEFVMSELQRITDHKVKHFISEPIVLGASISPKDYDVDGKSTYISMATIKGWDFDAANASYVSDDYAGKNSKKKVVKNDIIMARSGEGTIGKVALIQDDIDGVFADFTMRIRLKGCNPLFAYYYFRTTYFQYLIEIYKKGLGNNTNIFPIVIQEFPFPDISLTEQNRIVDTIQSEIKRQNDSKEKIVELRHSIDCAIESAISS